jgi:hypothetical protein
MGGIAGPLQQAVNTAGQAMGQVGGQIQQLGSPIGQAVGQVPQQPGNPFQMPLPSHYQSPYANYGFDPALQSYLDRQNYMSNNDAGVAFQYDPTNQTFTGGTMGGQYNPIPLSVMQQAAGGNRDVMAPYFQSRFPQPTGPVPRVKPGPFEAMLPGATSPVRPGPFQAMKQRYQGQPQPQTQPQNIQRGLGGLQIDKFRSRLGQR